MSDDIARLVAEEAASSEANRDAPLLADSAVGRPNRPRSAVYSVRLNLEEVASLQALAEEVGVPASTLVRSWIVDQLRSARGEFGEAEAELRAAQLHLAHLQRHLVRPVP
ncbi:MAG: hypothetical protein ACYCZN_09330 [Candidatus Dormibacteria bacterium]